MNQIPQIGTYLIQTVLRSSQDNSLAFLVEQSRVFYATQLNSTPHHSPHSAVTRLIQGIYQLYPDQALRIVRNRIYSTLLSPTPICYGMIKVAAKRASFGFQPDEAVKDLLLHEHNQWIDLTNWDRTLTESDHQPSELSVIDSPPLTHEELLHIVSNMAKNNQSVASLLVQYIPETGKNIILSSSLNSNSKNKTLHAEVNLLQSYFRKTQKPLPGNSIIYTSLKPCRMCASMIWWCSDRIETLKVFYVENDPGPHAKDTILSANTENRKRFCFNPSLLNLQIETLTPLT